MPIITAIRWKVREDSSHKIDMTVMNRTTNVRLLNYGNKFRLKSIQVHSTEIGRETPLSKFSCLHVYNRLRTYMKSGQS